MSESSFYWDSDTIDFYALLASTSWAATAFEIYKYVTDVCDWENERDRRALYLDLLTEVENRTNK